MLAKQPSTVKEARNANAVSTVIRVNNQPISNNGAISNLPGPSGITAPLSSITFNLVNATAGALTYVIGDPTGMVEGAAAPAVPWTKPTSMGSGGSVAGIVSSFQASPISINGLNYIVSNALQYDELPQYHFADRDNRYGRQPINLTAELRNSQFIATRQTLRFAQPYGMDEFHCFTLRVMANTTVSLTLLIGANAA